MAGIALSDRRRNDPFYERQQTGGAGPLGTPVDSTRPGPGKEAGYVPDNQSNLSNGWLAAVLTAMFGAGAAQALLSGGGAAGATAGGVLPSTDLSGIAPLAPGLTGSGPLGAAGAAGAAGTAAGFSGGTLPDSAWNGAAGTAAGTAAGRGFGSALARGAAGAGITALAGGLGTRGASGGSGTGSATLDALMPQLQSLLALQQRNALYTDPGAASLFPGVSVPQGAVPLQGAIANMAYGMLPTWAQSQVPK